jgi:hypothetical protein
MGFLTRRRRIGFVLVAVAFVPYAIASWHVTRYNWTPLDYGLRLHQGLIHTNEFVTEVAGTYILYLQVTPRKMDFQRQECLLDLELASFHPERCSEIPNVVELSWTLWTGAVAVADNTSEQSWRGGSYSNDYVRREIGRFQGQRGQRYSLSIDFRRDPSELNVANPKIVAEVIQDWDGFAVETQLSFALGVLLVIIGGIYLRPIRTVKPKTSLQE